MSNNDDFDWVTPRSEWNAKTAFSNLIAEVVEDHARLRAVAPNPAMLVSAKYLDDDSFLIKREGKLAIVFSLVNSEILIEKKLSPNDPSPTKIMTLIVTIDSHGNCVLVDQDGEHLKSWQVRMRALADSFFPE